jgi:hypothetical protein
MSFPLAQSLPWHSRLPACYFVHRDQVIFKSRVKCHSFVPSPASAHCTQGASGSLCRVGEPHVTSLHLLLCLHLLLSCPMHIQIQVFLPNAWQDPALGPLHWLFSVPMTFFPQIFCSSLLLQIMLKSYLFSELISQLNC